MADEEQKFNPMDEINYMRSLLDSIDTQMNSLVRGLDELKRAFYSLKDKDIESSEETRVSIGAGIFANARIEMGQKLLVPVGSSIYIEEDREKATARLERNIEDVQNSITSMGNQRDEISNRYQALVSYVQQQQTAGQGAEE